MQNKPWFFSSQKHDIPKQKFPHFSVVFFLPTSLKAMSQENWWIRWRPYEPSWLSSAFWWQVDWEQVDPLAGAGFKNVFFIVFKIIWWLICVTKSTDFAIHWFHLDFFRCPPSNVCFPKKTTINQMILSSPAEKRNDDIYKKCRNVTAWKLMTIQKFHKILPQWL